MKNQQPGFACVSGKAFDTRTLSILFCIFIPLSAHAQTVPEVLFPRNPGTPGTSLPFRENTPGLGDLEVMNYEGSSKNENKRMFWELDPMGSGTTVIRWELHDGDVGDAHGGHRSELGVNGDDHYIGADMWQAFAVYLPANFKTPDRWTIIKQNHTGDRSGQPMQTFRIAEGRDPNTVTSFEYHSKITAGGGGREVASLGRATRERWHFFVLYLELRTGSSGLTQVWYSVDDLPDLNRNPDYERRGPTIDSRPGYDRFGVYRKQGTSAHYPMVMYFSGYGRAGTGERAMENAGFFEISGADPPLLEVPAAPVLLPQ